LVKLSSNNHSHDSLDYNGQYTNDQINWIDVQRKNVVNNVDMSSLRASWQNGPYKTHKEQHKNTQHTKYRNKWSRMKFVERSTLPHLDPNVRDNFVKFQNDLYDSYFRRIENIGSVVKLVFLHSFLMNRKDNDNILQAFQNGAVLFTFG